MEMLKIMEENKCVAVSHASSQLAVREKATIFSLVYDLHLTRLYGLVKGLTLSPWLPPQQFEVTEIIYISNDEER